MIVMVIGLCVAVAIPYVFFSTWRKMYSRTPHGGLGWTVVKCVGCLIGSASITMSYMMILMFIDEQLGLIQGVEAREHVGPIICITLFVLMRFIYWCIAKALQGQTVFPQMTLPERSQDVGSTAQWRAAPYVSRQLGKNRAVARRARHGWAGNDR